MLNIGPPELILIFVIALVIVGPQRLPELGRSVGRGLREFRKMQDEVKDLVNTGMGDEFKQTTAELKQTASDLKSATDVRSAFRDEARRAKQRPHGVARPPKTGPALGTPLPDTEVPSPEPNGAGSATTRETGPEAPAEPDALGGPDTSAPDDGGTSGSDE
jgi:TatA/E family protein of Tat protein translocase